MNETAYHVKVRSFIIGAVPVSSGVGLGLDVIRRELPGPGWEAAWRSEQRFADSFEDLVGAGRWVKDGDYDGSPAGLGTRRREQCGPEEVGQVLQVTA